MNDPIYIELTPRGELPLMPKLPPLPNSMKGNPFGLDENGGHIRDIRGNVIKPVVLEMLANVEKRNPNRAREARAEAQEQLVTRLNSHIPSRTHYVSIEYLMRDGNLYSYEFNAFLHHICNELAGDPHYFYNIGLRVVGEAVGFLLRVGSLRQVYTTTAKIGSKFSSEQFEVLDATETSIVIQRRTPVTREQLGDSLWFVHVISGCHSMRGSLSTIPRIHSNLPNALIEDRKCLLHGDDCCEWKITWQDNAKRGLLGWLGGRR
ncbi:MAG: hypothetical protein HYZ24_12875 [Chloroflexi bacterium]|nr:hypothetical protein [Chloroflexota bacterium]